MKMPSADALRLGGTASATASSGSISIITTSTRRKLRSAWASSICCAVAGAAAIADAPQLVQVELVGLVAAAAAELVDHRQADRQVVAVEGERPRGRELGRNPGPAGPWSAGTGWCRGRRSTRKRPCSAVAATDMPAVVDLRRKCRGAGCPSSLAAVDAQGQALAEAVELADLDRRAERARLAGRSAGLRSGNGTRARDSRR